MKNRTEELIDILKYKEPTVFKECSKFKILDSALLACYSNSNKLYLYDVGSGTEKAILYEINNEKDDRTGLIRFSDRLKHQMILHGFDRNKLMELTGISRSTLSRYLNGRTYPTARHLDLIMQVLNCCYSDLFIRYDSIFNETKSSQY